MRTFRAVIAAAISLYVPALGAVATSCDLEEDGIGGPTAEAGFDATTGDGAPVGDATDEPLAPCFDAALPLCDDAACAPGTACTPPVPTGWHIVSVSRVAMTGCDGGYTALADGAPLLAFEDAGLACTCTCTKTAESTCATTASVRIGAAGGGCNASTTSVSAVPGACGAFDPMPPPANAAFSIRVTQAATPPACAPNATSDVPTYDGGRVQVCAMNGEPPGLCDRHRFCAPVSGEAICVAHDGVATCPAGYVATSATAGVDADTRACTPCTCSADAGACVGRITGYPNGSSCNGGNAFGAPWTVIYDGGCADFPDGYGGSTSNVDLDGGPTVGTCTAVGGQPTGTLVPNAVTTVCCAP